jgi:hypothetical protein
MLVCQKLVACRSWSGARWRCRWRRRLQVGPLLINSIRVLLRPFGVGGGGLGEGALKGEPQRVDACKFDFTFGDDKGLLILKRRCPLGAYRFGQLFDFRRVNGRSVTAARPWRRAFALALFLPLAVRGPVLFCELRFAASCLEDVMMLPSKRYFPRWCSSCSSETGGQFSGVSPNARSNGWGGAGAFLSGARAIPFSSERAGAPSSACACAVEPVFAAKGLDG